ncbi:hypothetical protein CRG93_24550 [Escherichia sp. E2593]|nr:hypothetical protein CRG93_24550 [Escherichia sp. E2593]
MLYEQKKVYQTTNGMIVGHRAHTAAKHWKRCGAIWWHEFRYSISSFFLMLLRRGRNSGKGHPVWGEGGWCLKGGYRLWWNYDA